MTGLITGFISLLLFHGCTPKEDEEYQFGSEEITTLPMDSLPLENLDPFQTNGDNWVITGNAWSDYKSELSIETEEGSGVLVSFSESDESADILSRLEHGDIELRLEFLIPKNSNSGIYFQDRYELQILDSWLRDDARFYDAGGIYERWDESRPEGERGFEGHDPLVNASLAPGLWQEFHVLFRAPRFDEEGNKTENARFDWVYLNGVRVQEGVELTGPTRGGTPGNEVAKAPFRLQGDHGPVAFRNIEYKTYNQTDSLTLGPLTYEFFEYTGDRTPENFDELELIAEGVADSFNVADLAPQDEHYASRFTGDLEVPVSGEYFFQTGMYNGGNLYINGELLIRNTGEIEYQILGNTVFLEEGTHEIQVTHFQAVWISYIHIDYEGPGIEKRPLAREPEAESAAREPLTVYPEIDQPELVGGFFNYEGNKKTHTLSVGHSEGVHYSYDLGRGSLLSFWRNPFADVSQMWRGRGHEQLLVPMNAAMESASGVPLAIMGWRGSLSEPWPDDVPGIQQYQLDENERPVFTSVIDGITIEDLIQPSQSGTELERILRFRSEDNRRNKTARLTQASSVELLPNGLYRINGRYYINILSDGGSEPQILEHDGYEALIIPVLHESAQSEISYQLIW